MKKAYLISYWYRTTSGFEGYGYDIIHNIPDWIDYTQECDGDLYILLNALEITEAQADKWWGNLKGM